MVKGLSANHWSHFFHRLAAEQTGVESRAGVVEDTQLETDEEECRSDKRLCFFSQRVINSLRHIDAVSLNTFN